MRLLIAVLVVAALAYGLIWGWRQAVQHAGDYVQEVIFDSSGSPGAETLRFASDYDLAGAGGLTIENDFGSVQVHPGGSEVSVGAIVYAGGKEPKALARAANVSLTSSHEPDGGYLIRVKGDRERPRVRIDLAVEVPPDVALHLRLQSGNARVTGHKASVDISTSSGDVFVQGVGAGLAATAVSGSVEAEASMGPVRVQTASGSIDLVGLRGDVSAKASSGRISMRDVRGTAVTAEIDSGPIELTGLDARNIRAHAVSGGLRLALARPFAGQLEAQATSGPIALSLPSGSSCRVRASTSSGVVSSNLPLVAASSSRGEVKGRLGTGLGSVVLHTTSGSITLEPASLGNAG